MKIRNIIYRSAVNRFVSQCIKCIHLETSRRCVLIFHYKREMVNELLYYLVCFQLM